MDTGDRVLQLHNFMGHETGTYAFPSRGLVRLQGHSGAGKSTVLAAFAWVVGYGPETVKGVDVGLILERSATSSTTATASAKGARRQAKGNPVAATTSVTLSWDHVTVYRQCRPALWTVSLDGQVVSDDPPAWFERRYGGAMHKEMIPLCMYLEQNAQSPFVGEPTDTYKTLAQHCLRPIPVKAASEAIKKGLIKKERMTAGLFKDRWAQHSLARPDCLAGRPAVAVVRSENIDEVLEQPGLALPEPPEEDAPSPADVSAKDQLVGECRARLAQAVARQDAIARLLAVVCPTDAIPAAVGSSEWLAHALAKAVSVIDRRRRASIVDAFFEQGSALLRRRSRAIKDRFQEEAEAEALAAPARLAALIVSENWAGLPVVPRAEQDLADIKSAKGAIRACLQDLFGDPPQDATLGSLVAAKRAETVAFGCCPRAQRAWLYQQTSGPDWAEASELETACSRHKDTGIGAGIEAVSCLAKTLDQYRVRLDQARTKVSAIDRFREELAKAADMADQKNSTRLDPSACAVAAAEELVRVSEARSRRLAAAAHWDKDAWARLGLRMQTEDPNSSFASTASFFGARDSVDEIGQAGHRPGADGELCELTTELAELALGTAPVPLDAGRDQCPLEVVRTRLVGEIRELCLSADAWLADLTSTADTGDMLEAQTQQAEESLLLLASSEGQALRHELRKLGEDLVQKRARLARAQRTLGVSQEAVFGSGSPAVLDKVAVDLAARCGLERLCVANVGQARHAIATELAASLAGREPPTRWWRADCPCCNKSLQIDAHDGGLEPAGASAATTTSWSAWVLGAPAAMAKGHAQQTHASIKIGSDSLSLTDCNKLAATFATLADDWTGDWLAQHTTADRDAAFSDIALIPKQIEGLGRQIRQGLSRLYASDKPVPVPKEADTSHSGSDADSGVELRIGQLKWLDRLVLSGKTSASVLFERPDIGISGLTLAAIAAQVRGKALRACAVAYRQLDALCPQVDFADPKTIHGASIVALALAFLAEVGLCSSSSESEQEVRTQLAQLEIDIAETERAILAHKAVELRDRMIEARVGAGVARLPLPHERVFVDVRVLDRVEHSWFFPTYQHASLRQLAVQEAGLTEAAWNTEASRFATQAATKDAVDSIMMDHGHGQDGQRVDEAVFLAASQLAALLQREEDEIATAGADVGTLQIALDAAMADAQETKELAARWAEFSVAEEWVGTARTVLQEYNDKEDALSASELAAVAIDTATNDAICSVIADIERNANRLIQDLFANCGGGVTVQLAVDRVKNTLSTVVRIGTREGDARRVGLSGGERSRVDMAVQAAACVALDCPFLLIDEGTGALDPANAHQSIRALRWLAQDRLIVVTSHQVMEDCSRSEFDKVIEVGVGACSARNGNATPAVDGQKASKRPRTAR